MKPPELKFRHFLEPRMRDHWMMTWHEDREISPGVPDLHYIPLNPGHQNFRVGWLELKAVDKLVVKKFKIGVEASQHQYIRRWRAYMPIHFLVRIVDRVYLVDGNHHKELTYCTTDVDIRALAITDFHETLIAEELPPYLRDITRI